MNDPGRDAPAGGEPAGGAEHLSPRRRWAWSLGISAVVSVVLVWLVARQLDFAKLVEVLGSLQWSWVAVGFGATLVHQALRTSRTALLLPVAPAFGRLFSTLCLQSFARKMLPAWLGEVVMIWLLRRLHEVRLHRGTAVVLALRLVDLLLFAVALAIFLAINAHKIPQTILLLAVALIGITLAASIGALVLGALGRLSERRVAGAARAGGVLAWMAHHVVSLGAELRELAGTGRLLPMLGYTVVMWLVMFYIFCTYAWALGFGLSAADMLWVYVLVFPVSLLPISGIANFGTHEAAWFAGLALLGVTSGEAAVLAFGSHALVLLGAFGLLAVGLVGLRYPRGASGPRGKESMAR